MLRFSGLAVLLYLSACFVSFLTMPYRIRTLRSAKLRAVLGISPLLPISAIISPLSVRRSTPAPTLVRMRLRVLCLNSRVSAQEGVEVVVVAAAVVMVSVVEKDVAAVVAVVVAVMMHTLAATLSAFVALSAAIRPTRAISQSASVPPALYTVIITRVYARMALVEPSETL